MSIEDSNQESQRDLFEAGYDYLTAASEMRHDGQEPTFPEVLRELPPDSRQVIEDRTDNSHVTNMGEARPKRSVSHYFDHLQQEEQQAIKEYAERLYSTESDIVLPAFIQNQEPDATEQSPDYEVPDHVQDAWDLYRVTLPHADKNTTGQQLADTLAVEGAVMECSIAASDAAQAAAKKFERATRLHTKEIDGQSVKLGKTQTYLNFVEGNTTHQRDVTVDWITRIMPTSGGYPVRLGLVRSEENKTDIGAHPSDLKLVAELRDGLTFPLVHFSRSSKAYCDYLQFWGEAEHSELESANFYGWGQDKNGSRFDAVQLVLKQLRGFPVTDFSKLTDALQLDQRIESQIGAYNEDVEEIIKIVFKKPSDSLAVEFKREYANVDIGKVKTNITVAGSVNLTPSDMLTRQLTIRQHPTSQPDRNWPEKTLIVNKNGTLAFINEDGELSAPSKLDLQVIRELLESPSDNVYRIAIAESNKSLQKLATIREELQEGKKIKTPQKITSAVATGGVVIGNFFIGRGGELLLHVTSGSLTALGTLAIAKTYNFTTAQIKAFKAFKAFNSHDKEQK